MCGGLLVARLQGDNVVGAPCLVACDTGDVIDLPTMQQLKGERDGYRCRHGVTDKAYFDTRLLDILLQQLCLEVARFPVGIANDGIKAQHLELGHTELAIHLVRQPVRKIWIEIIYGEAVEVAAVEGLD